jgi:hypothetical protein
MSLFRYNPEIHDNPEFLPDGAQWTREGGGGAPPTPLAALLSARNRAQAYSPMLSQLLQTDPTSTARGTDQTQMPTDSFDSNSRPSVTPAQYLGPRLGPFIEAIKPGFEFGMDTLGARKGPQAPPFPKNMGGKDFTKEMGWENAMKAEPWAKNLQKNPPAADQLAKNLLEKNVTKKDIEQWGNFYEQMFRHYPDNKQFFWRSEGLRLLKDRFPSAPPASTPWICPPGWECS